MTAGRGQCPVCRYRWRWRKDGTLQPHHLYSGSERRPECEGSGKEPRPWDPHECTDCMVYLGAHPFLVEACASVGIERGRDTGSMLWDYLSDFHERGHQEAA